MPTCLYFHDISPLFYLFRWKAWRYITPVMFISISYNIQKYSVHQWCSSWIKIFDVQKCLNFFLFRWSAWRFFTPVMFISIFYNILQYPKKFCSSVMFILNQDSWCSKISQFFFLFRWPAWRYITPVMFVSIFYNIPRFFELEVYQLQSGDPNATMILPALSHRFLKKVLNFWNNYELL